MNYKLLKQMKDRGFNFTEIPNYKSDKILDRYNPVLLFGGGSLYAMPTLSELIEACGDEFVGLVKGQFMVWDYEDTGYSSFTGFFAGTLDGRDGSTLSVDYEPHGYGKTPEEAVARLWLSFNKTI